MTIHVAIFQENNLWVAQALEHDVCAQGENKAMAVYELLRLVHAYMDIGTLVTLPPAPDFYWERQRLTLHC